MGWRKPGIKCESCGTDYYLTRHHLKNPNGKKNGKIVILCWPCHRQAEEEYRLHGIVKPPPKINVKIAKNEKLFLDYINGTVPYYSLMTKDGGST